MTKPLHSRFLSFVALPLCLVVPADAQLFHTSNRCIACHSGLVTPSGEEISIGFDWRASMMANSARDPYWQAAVRRETIDHPASRAAIEDECAKCHMPMARFAAKTAGRNGQVFAHLPVHKETPDGRLAADGVSCTLCHQIQNDNFGTRESYVGEFLIDTRPSHSERSIYGPFEVDAGRQTIMRSSTGVFQPTEGLHVQQSELCATCHTLFTHALGADGQIIGTLAEQVPYLEWLHSDYRKTKSCQGCHMPVVQDDVPITSVLGEPRDGFSRHVFRGGNFFMLRMLNRYRDELGVEALPQELEMAATRTAAHLKANSARISIDSVELRDGLLQADVSVRNLVGHKLPTAYPSRRAWLHVVLRDQNNRLVFESGALDQKGLIKGNDNDANASRYEPHYTEISSADQVQIYEAIMLDREGNPTTGLLSAVRFGKDNRLLPRGFEKGKASDDIAVHGNAHEDGDFNGGGDLVRYSMPVGDAPGPFEIEVGLWYQPISYRWAQNLRSYDSGETRRFTKYYSAMAPGSALLLRSTEAVCGSNRVSSGTTRFRD